MFTEVGQKAGTNDAGMLNKLAHFARTTSQSFLYGGACPKSELGAQQIGRSLGWTKVLKMQDMGDIHV